MNYYIYQITNLLDEKIYIGKRTTKKEPHKDKYLGSSDLVKRAIQKYGLENFRKDILCCCYSSEELEAKEAELVNESFIKRSDTYNRHVGGKGGWQHINNDPSKRKEVSEIAKTWCKENNWVPSDFWTEDNRKTVIANAKKIQKKATEAARSVPKHIVSNHCLGSRFYIDPCSLQRKRFIQEKQPSGWILLKEHYELTRTIPERWFNDGNRNYLIPYSDSRVKDLNLVRGRIKAQQPKG